MRLFTSNAGYRRFIENCNKAVEIHHEDENGWHFAYTAHSPGSCKDETDKSAYIEAVLLRDIVTMGSVMAVPASAFYKE